MSLLTAVLSSPLYLPVPSASLCDGQSHRDEWVPPTEHGAQMHFDKIRDQFPEMTAHMSAAAQVHFQYTFINFSNKHIMITTAQCFNY